MTTHSIKAHSTYLVEYLLNKWGRSIKGHPIIRFTPKNPWGWDRMSPNF
jgi:hypothetical protein